MTETIKRGDLQAACEKLCATIEGTGGIYRDQSGQVRPVGDDDWIDLADAYVAICTALGRNPVFGRGEAVRFVHQYDTTTCPSCQRDLASAGGVMVVFNDGIQAFELPSQLDLEGFLEDPSGLVAQGWHSDTLCGGCGESLSDFEVVSVGQAEEGETD